MTSTDRETIGMPPVRTVVLSLGTNIGDPFETLQGAVDLLLATPGVKLVGVSPIYRTTPVGPVTDQPDFHNLVLVVEAALTSAMILDRVDAVEQAYGRQRDVPGGPRTLDVDIITIGERHIDRPELTVPHPRAHERAFVLVPWSDVDPDAELPGYGRVVDLLARFDADDVANAVKPYPRQIDVADVTVARGWDERHDEEDL
ncbi:2-amino-4-hydroxy-6-hydroxymethyldihydropteridine diphosphokinase [Cutibacterium avidum]|nr:2-amino-4-hydroxy-6-hydroxymethyldihydropteridine diphosphokinase [Propionibacterium sp. KPL2005]ERS30220.1 2-amino-4-hydroxy-6-hydroxymethyldihydropteridine diphosphokinase [Propionibacterium sp. KPL2000]KXA68313.1 2-amino-4-hydroxy-6-hydroxymethyldihydropteridine diphosphokinase [Cutibacterium avidum]PGX61024.1 2-amino-4-hydroxy-6-hydroxymethyldihydropteridine diphosphokinase [Cutibacterium avidum]PGX66020.1 2-amino-4-hydroxy-6-hydroxymethyldihydropteridine diphosphokinase [Cutibacterium a